MTHLLGIRRRSSLRATLLVSLLALATMVPAATAGAQARVGRDSSTRLNRYARDLGYGAIMALLYSGIDQAQNNPSEWGHGGSGYGKRYASNFGEFVVQETTSGILAAALKRPLDYQPSPHRTNNARIGWALQQSVTDAMPDGSHPVAIPRIVGAYAGSFAQASWRPGASSDRTRVALVNGTVSLLIGAGLNLYHEFRR